MSEHQIQPPPPGDALGGAPDQSPTLLGMDVATPGVVPSPNSEVTPLIPEAAPASPDLVSSLESAGQGFADTQLPEAATPEPSMGRLRGLATRIKAMAYGTAARATAIGTGIDTVNEETATRVHQAIDRRLEGSRESGSSIKRRFATVAGFAGGFAVLAVASPAGAISSGSAAARAAGLAPGAMDNLDVDLGDAIDHLPGVDFDHGDAGVHDVAGSTDVDISDADLLSHTTPVDTDVADVGDHSHGLDIHTLQEQEVPAHDAHAGAEALTTQAAADAGDDKIVVDHTKPLPEWTGEPAPEPEDALYDKGTGWGEWEAEARKHGLTTEDILTLEANGTAAHEVHDLLDDNGITLSSEATGAEGEVLDTELAVGRQLEITDEMEQDLDNLSHLFGRDEANELMDAYEQGLVQDEAEAVLTEQGVTEAQLEDVNAALDGVAADLTDQELAGLYEGTGLTPPLDANVDSMSDLPIPFVYDPEHPDAAPQVHPGFLDRLLHDNARELAEILQSTNNTEDEEDGSGNNSNLLLVAGAAAALGLGTAVLARRRRAGGQQAQQGQGGTQQQASAPRRRRGPRRMPNISRPSWARLPSRRGRGQQPPPPPPNPNP